MLIPGHYCFRLWPLLPERFRVAYNISPSVLTVVCEKDLTKKKAVSL